MATQLTLGQILRTAIQKEIESQHFYGDLSQKVNNDTAREVLQQLSQQEQWHQKVLEQYRQVELKGGILNRGKVVDYRTAEHFDQPEIAPRHAA